LVKLLEEAAEGQEAETALAEVGVDLLDDTFR